MSVYSSWVHGHSVLLERKGSGGATGKSSVLNAFGGDPGDIVELGLHSTAACLRIGWAARFVIYDSGLTDLEKSGDFFCHYAIPTPVLVAGQRAEADTVLINYESTNINALSIAAVHVWDGNKRIFADDSPIASADDFNGGIPGAVFNNSALNPNLSLLFKGDIQKRPIFFGVGVSLRIRAQNAKNDFLEIRGVGIDFQVK